MERLRRVGTTGALALGGVLSLSIVALVLLGQRARVLWPFTVDDTYITLQYARHLAEGYGPSWNIGGPRAEGYTTVLWMLLLSLVEWCGFDGVLGAKLLSLAFCVLALALSALLAAALSGSAKLPVRAFSASLPFVLGASYWKLSVHAVSGMETTFTAALVAAFALCLVRITTHGTSPRRARALAVCGLMASLARPEVALLASVGWLVSWCSARGAARRALLRAALAFAIVPGALYFAARYAWFGLPFPLPFYVKAAGHGGLAGVPDVAAFCADFLRDRPFVLALAAGTLAARPRLSAAPALAALALVCFFLVPSHIMGFESRYLMPVVPVLFALAGAGAGIVLERASRWLDGRQWQKLAFDVGAWAVLGFAAARPFPAGFSVAAHHWRAYGQGLHDAHLALAADLREVAPLASHRVVAMLDVGAVAYASDWSVIDTYGLNDARVALSRRTDINYIFAQAPDVVVLVSEQPDSFVPVFDWEVPIAQRAREGGFVRVKSYPFEADYHLEIYAQRGALLAALRLGTRGHVPALATAY